ncbi:MAG: magnesium transporter [Candidatus Hydrothermarchaeota archaeon]
MVYTVKRILKESIPFLIMSMFLDLASGGMLESKKELFISIPGIIILVPPMINLAGSIGSVLGSRISSFMHLGLDLRNLAVKDSMVALFIGIISSITLGFLGYIVYAQKESGVTVKIFVKITVLAGVITVSSMIVLTILIIFLSYLKGYDPDNVFIPIVASIGDIVGIASLLIVIGLLY